MFIILLSLVFTTCILAAPAPTSNPPWIKLKEDNTLQRFHSTLLNETLLPFLNECYSGQQEKTSIRESKTREIICSRYFDAVLQLNSTDYVVNEPKLIEIRDQVDDKVAFCDQKHIFPARKYFLKAPQRDFGKSAVCGLSCLEDDAETPKISCRLLAWMGEEIQKNSAEIKKHVAVEATPSVTPPSAPAAAAGIPAEVIPAAPTKEPAIGQAPTKEKDAPVNEKAKNTEADAKTDDATNAEKPAPNTLNNDKPVAPQSNVHVEEPIKSEAKDKVNQGPLPSPTKAVNFVPNVPATPKTEQIEKKPEPPVDEEPKDDNAQAPLNSDAQDIAGGVQLIPPNNKPVSGENPESEEELNSIGDDAGVENEDYKDTISNIKPNNVGIANPEETDHNQSSSPEIIVGNDIVNNKPVVDPFLEESGSNFFTYFLIGMFLCIAMYVLYHNKSKVLALLLEGRRGDKGRGGRRKHTAAYRKLDSNLEEAITSPTSGRTTQIIY